MKIRLADIGSAVGYASSLFILGSSLPIFATAAKMLPVAGPPLAKGITAIVGAVSPYVPAVLGGLATKVTALAVGIGGFGGPLLIAAAAVSLAFAVPWAIEQGCKLVDGLIAQTELGIAKIKSTAVMGKERVQLQQSHQQDYSRSSGLPLHQQTMSAITEMESAPTSRFTDKISSRGITSNYTDAVLSASVLPPSQMVR